MDMVDKVIEDKRGSFKSVIRKFNVAKFNMEAEKEEILLRKCELSDFRTSLEKFLKMNTNPQTGTICADKYLR